ncbi:MAU2 chromatid cohesion factor homolog isoform X2 [Paramacrobiotus metropolitanus]|uniref:MAU2 chromatid cohesion factor homolog isoform X2 n=1 Tax=Paramacrobiotus metropolitanus TaxID=2943436 RepID=UPI0024458A1E|nr:MAU2 chromatid cohesion factor homolog isoform X2 [Paramacrobiotus metropolitanus]
MSTSHYPTPTPDPTSAWSSAEQYEMYVALLGLAESLRSQGEPAGAYHCLVAILALNVPHVVSARIHCEIGKLLLRHSDSQDVAKYYLDSAVNMGLHAQNGSALEEARLDASSALADYYVAHDDVAQARDILHTAIEQSQHSPYWQCHFIFQLANVFVQGQDHTVATQILTLGESFSARHQADYLTTLFQLARAHVFIRGKQYQSAVTSLADIGSRLDAATAQVSVGLRDELRFYLIALEALCRLNMGQAKSVRPYVAPLQAALDQLTQNAAQAPPADHPLQMFALAPRSMFPALHFAISAQFFALVGYHDKLDRLVHRCKSFFDGLVGTEHGALRDELRCVMYQHAIPTSLSTGRFNQALEQISDYITLWWCQSPEMLALLTANQALLYYKQQRWLDLLNAAQRSLPDQAPDHVGLRCSAFIVQALKALAESRFADGQVLLQRALQLSNAEDLNQMMANSLMLLARNCAALAQWDNAFKAAKAAADLADKIPAPQLSINALKLISDVAGHVGDHASRSTAVQQAARFGEREAQELALVQRNPKLNTLQWTGG